MVNIWINPSFFPFLFHSIVIYALFIDIVGIVLICFVSLFPLRYLSMTYLNEFRAKQKESEAAAYLFVEKALMADARRAGQGTKRG